MTPLTKLILVICTIGLGGILIATTAEAQEAEPVIEWTMDDFERCSLLLRGQNRSVTLIDPFGSKLDKIQSEIDVLKEEVDTLGEQVVIYFEQIEAASAAGDWVAEEEAIRKHNTVAEEGNIVSTNIRYLTNLYIVVERGLNQRIEVFNKLNTEYLSNCVHEWPPVVVDTVCRVDAPTTFDFCEKFPNDE